MSLWPSLSWSPVLGVGSVSPCRFAFMSLLSCALLSSFVFFFNDTATTEIYTLSLHDALPIWRHDEHLLEATVGGQLAGCLVEGIVLVGRAEPERIALRARELTGAGVVGQVGHRSEEHTSELQSHLNLVCRLLLEKKKR